MGFVDDELAEVKKLAEHVVLGCRLVACTKSMVRAEITRTRIKTIIICMQFPENYPKEPLLFELKSKFLSEKLLQRLSNVCENDIKGILGKPQIMKVLSFVRNFIDENPLICCYDEINNLKKNLSENDEIKLKQKTSSLMLKFVNKKYIFSCKCSVPDVYPDEAISLKDIESNFPPAILRHVEGQAKEIARKRVEPPLRKPRVKELPFKPSPSLEISLQFVFNCVQKLPFEKCQFCRDECLPEDPNLIVIDETSGKHVERVYCGHLFHQECLLKYMKTPPFGNKTCQSCRKKICHFKWNLTDQLAEARWAHGQARERELAEVEDFFK